MRPAWDIMIDEETYQLLEEYYSREMELSDVISNMDRDGIVRLLDNIIEEPEEFGDEEMVARARKAKRKL